VVKEPGNNKKCLSNEIKGLKKFNRVQFLKLKLNENEYQALQMKHTISKQQNLRYCI